ncbi:hypothetical protein [Ilyobacter polytropus]|uniref:Viral A-type inclusion protein repeat protein n=1 Tax=Ilyobacter polytropus (strain ATCC 51220 / DSM 2926 / LMG 16218 / CuHBu1) TaxID=572544 RepID=E3HBR4_ILYPC|nr:hypothetical protein [Ilyobacter polytropus]ADO83826.1 Viral A-type inclusion protein repeat protein [Ilyobacter polytropus DSM 2926]
MEKIDKIMTQTEYMELLNEFRMLEMEEEITGKDNSVRMNEIKELLEIDEEEDD